MEVVLQWLDEVEDLIFTIALLRERLSAGVLQVGLLASLTLHATQWWSVTTAHASFLFAIASSSVALWAFAQLPMPRERARLLRPPVAT